MAKDEGTGAAGKEEREEFGQGNPQREAEKRNPDRSPGTHDAWTKGQKVDSTGTPGAGAQWPSSQPGRGK